MKKNHLFFIMPLLAAILFSCDKTEVGPAEAVLFNDTIDWQWIVENNPYGGNSFYWWHHPSMGMEDLGELSDNWKKPNDFENGAFFLRVEILEQPTDSAFKLQLGFWQDKQKAGGHSETVSARKLMTGGPGTIIEADLGSPSSWWQLREDALVDFTRPTDFYQVGLALWKAEPMCVPMGQGWNNSNACSDPVAVAAEFFPMKAHVTVIGVAAGHTFSGWESY